MIDAFAAMAASLSAAFGGPFHDATVVKSRPTLNAGGSVATGQAPVTRTCQCQVDACTDAMRREQGYQDKDVRLLILAGTLDGDVEQGERVTVGAGPGAGTYIVMSIDRDPIGIYHECRGRLA